MQIIHNFHKTVIPNGNLCSQVEMKRRTKIQYNKSFLFLCDNFSWVDNVSQVASGHLYATTFIVNDNNAYLATYTSQWLLRVFDVVCICLRFIISVTVPSFGNVITFRYVHKYVQLLRFEYVSEAVIIHQSGEHSQVIYKQLCSWGQDSCIQNIHSISISTINVINRLVQTDKDIA